MMGGKGSWAAWGRRLGAAAVVVVSAFVVRWEVM